MYETQADADAVVENDDTPAEAGVFSMEGEEAVPKKDLVHPNGGDFRDEGIKVDPKDIGAVKDMIATSPCESMSSLDSASNGRIEMGRRMSNVSEEEREKARAYREGVRGEMKRGGKSQQVVYIILSISRISVASLDRARAKAAASVGHSRQEADVLGVDLAHIAKTSYGIAQSPPSRYNPGPAQTRPSEV